MEAFIDKEYSKFVDGRCNAMRSSLRRGRTSTRREDMEDDERRELFGNGKGEGHKLSIRQPSQEGKQFDDGKKYYLCVVCSKVIPEDTIAAADKSCIFMKCCKCIGRECCITGCDEKVAFTPKEGIVYVPCCEKHRYSGQCRNSIYCSDEVINGKFCPKHTCCGLLKDGSSCRAEAIPFRNICPFHLAVALAKEKKDEKKEEKKVDKKGEHNKLDMMQERSFKLRCDDERMRLKAAQPDPNPAPMP